MVKFMCGLVLGLMLVALPASAQQVAPIEIHVQEGRIVSVYECWWSSVVEADSSPIVAYINSVQGQAMYVCYLAERFEIEPVESDNHKDSRA